MGNASGKSKGDATSELTGADNLSERETSATWYRYGVEVTDVYDVIEVLGQGHMGEVFTVRRKITGMHNETSRERMKHEEKLLAEKEKKEQSRGNPTKVTGKTIMKAAGKGKKVMTKIGVGGKNGDSKGEENSNLQQFIRSDTCESHEPPKKGNNIGTPVKSILRSDSVGKRLHHQDSEPMEDNISERSSGSAAPSPGGTSKRKSHKKGVHFQRTFAVKTILTSRINKDQIQELVNEIMIMRKLDHPYVLKLYEVYHVKRKLWLVTELCTGGDLSSRKLNEHDTKNVVEQVLRALVYLHRMGVAHRDIKLENILYENHSPTATIRLIDFGLSKTFDRTSKTLDYMRTPYTMSPEAATHGKDHIVNDKTDVWALGVITWVMLSGDFPFIKTTSDLKDSERMEKLKRADYHFGVTWKGRGITPNAKEFVKGCLQKDPAKRWTAKQALEHVQNRWGPEVDKIWDEWREEMKKLQKPEFVRPQDLPGDNDEDSGVKEEVESADAAKKDEAELNVKDQGVSTAESDDTDDYSLPKLDQQERAQNIKKHVQKVVWETKSKKEEVAEEEETIIDMEEIERYTKFGFLKKTILLTMANTMDRSDLGKLREIFLKADTMDTGTITMQELKDAFQKVAPETDTKKVEELFKGIDRDKSGHIHYAEFLAALAESHGLVTLDRLTEAFDRIDADGKGYITHDDLKSILGNDYDKAMVDKMIEEGDFKKNNKIDYEELLQYMFDDPAKGAEIAGNAVSSSRSVSFDSTS